MIIDAHAHIDESPEFGWFDPPEVLLAEMDHAGIDKAVVMTYADVPGINRDALQYLARALSRYPGRFYAYARINPFYGAEAVQLLDEAITNGFKGLKLHPESVLAHPYHEATLRVIRRAAERRAPVLFHCGDEALSLPLQVARAAELVPEATIIMGHMGGYFHVPDAILAAERLDNLILETSAMPYPAHIREAVRRIGAERVIFGSDGPGCNPALEVRKVRMAGLSDRDLAKVLGENMELLLDRVDHGRGGLGG